MCPVVQDFFHHLCETDADGELLRAQMETFSVILNKKT